MDTVIFDIDGTLADLDHRLHHIANHPKDYIAFYEECDRDAVIQPIADLLCDMHALGRVVLLVSGRTDRVRLKTEQWLNNHGVPFDGLYMRRDGDWRSDTIVKSKILDEIVELGHKVRFVVDDRTSVVKMWRDRGLTCLQCREWQETPKAKKGKLHLMVGPSGGGKTTWLNASVPSSQIVSSDAIRHDLLGDFKDQSKNAEVFAALHQIVKTRLEHGLPTYVDAPNIKRKDRVTIAQFGDEVEYIIIDRPIEEKRRDGGWRNELGFDLLAKHQQTFDVNLKDILRGDGLPNVTVKDFRTVYELA